MLSEYSKDYDMWKTIYYHQFSYYEDLIHWCRTTGLRPFLSVLNEKEKEEFESELLEKLKYYYKPYKDSRIVIECPRLFYCPILAIHTIIILYIE